MKLKGLVVLSALLSSQFAFAGPFGIEMGMSIKDVPNIRMDGDSKFSYAFMPDKPHPDLNSYAIKATPKTGVCVVAASNDQFNNLDSYGHAIKDAFNNLEKALLIKYGEPHKRYDFLASDALYDEPREWLMSMIKKERYLLTVWKFQNNPDHISAIAISTNVESLDYAYITVRYEFNNTDECLEIIDRSESDLL